MGPLDVGVGVCDGEDEKDDEDVNTEEETDINEEVHSNVVVSLEVIVMSIVVQVTLSKLFNSLLFLLRSLSQLY
jgi:hypothetical protein